MEYGYWRRNRARNISELSVLTEVVDPCVRAAEASAAALPVGRPTSEEVFADRVVLLVSPAVRLESRKRLFAEKRPGLNIREAKALAALGGAPSALMLGHLLQYQPLYLRLREPVHDGRTRSAEL